MPPALKLYVKVWCPWCVVARVWLDAHGYRYALIDVEKERGSLLSLDLEADIRESYYAVFAAKSVLVAVDPGLRQTEIVTGPDAKHPLRIQAQRPLFAASTASTS